jgi:hypothetical protein
MIQWNEAVEEIPNYNETDDSYYPAEGETYRPAGAESRLEDQCRPTGLPMKVSENSPESEAAHRERLRMFLEAYLRSVTAGSFLFVCLFLFAIRNFICLLTELEASTVSRQT